MYYIKNKVGGLLITDKLITDKLITYTVQYSTMADLLNSIMFSRASYSGISFNMKSRVKIIAKNLGFYKIHIFSMQPIRLTLPPP